MNLEMIRKTNHILQLALYEMPDAIAEIYSDDICGTVEFYDALQGMFILYEFMDLPQKTGGIFGFHIHEGKSCMNDTDVPYEKTGGHFNPTNQKHPHHLGDLPPIFAQNGYAWGMIYIDRLKVKDIIGRTIVIHEHSDDLHSQPAGNSGMKIACGKIHSLFKEV